MGLPMGITGTPLLKVSREFSEGRVKEEDQIVVSVGPSVGGVGWHSLIK